MKYLITIAVFLLVAFSVAKAQYNMSTTYLGHNDLNAARYEPSELNLGEKHFQFGFNSYLWMGNSAMTYADLQEIFFSSADINRDLDKFISELDDKNILGAGFDVQLAGIAFQIRDGKQRPYDLSFTVVDKFGATMQFSKTMAQLIWQGNAQFAGQTIDLGTFDLSALYFREYAVGAAFPIYGSRGRDEDDGFGLRMGFRAKYLQGISSIHMRENSATMTTAADGSQISFDWDYTVETSGLNDYENFDPMAFNGRGFGFDVGIAAFFGRHFEVNASVMDIGSITFTEQTRHFSKNGVETYDGAVIGNFFGDFDFDASSVDYLYQPDEKTGESYTQAIATRFLVQAEYKTPHLFQGREEVSNAIFLTYVQGFTDAPGVTTRPFVSLAYNHDFHHVFDMGLMVAYGGFNRLMLGTFASFAVGDLMKIGFGTDNLTGLIVPNDATGIDAQVSLSFTL